MKATLRDATGTGPRFVLLVILVTASSIRYLGGPLALLESVVFPHVDRSQPDCFLAAGWDPAGSDLEMLQTTMHQAPALDRCLAAEAAPVSYRGLVAAVVLLVLGALVYWWLPAVRDRRRRVVPIEAVDADGTLTAELTDLCIRTGIRSRPRFLIDATRLTSGAAVHGRTGRYTVRLHAGLVAQRATDRDRFHAVVLHELAHIHHRDVDYAYATTALWRVYVAVALLPSLAFDAVALAIGFRGDLAPAWHEGSRIFVADIVIGLLLAGLVHLARADLLRHRELQADLRAVAWGARPAVWGEAAPTGTLRPLLHRSVTVLRTHPGWAQRRQALAAGRISGAGAMELFLAGTSIMLFGDALEALPWPRHWQDPSLWVTVVLVAPVLCLSLGLPVARASRTAGIRTESGARAGLWLGCGLLTAAVITGARARMSWLPVQPLYLVAFLFIGAVPAVWYSQCLRLAVALPSRRSRRTAVAIVVLTTALLLAEGLRWWKLGGAWVSQGVSDPGGSLATWLSEKLAGSWQDYHVDLSVLTFTLPLLTPLMADALAAATMLLAWVVPMVLAVILRSGFGLRRTLGAGLAGGLLSWAGLAMLTYVLYPHRPPTIRERTGVYLAVHLWWTDVTVLAACLLTAASVAAVSRQHWLLRALIAAPVVQIIAYAGAFGLWSADGCLGPLNSVVDRCWRSHVQAGVDNSQGVIALTLVNAVLGAAFAAVAGASVAWAVRRRRTRPAPTADAPPAAGGRYRRHHRVLAAGVVLALAVPLTALTVRMLASTTRSDLPRMPTPTSRGQDQLPPTQQATLRREQLTAWRQLSGIPIAQQIDTAITALNGEMQIAANQPVDGDGEVTPDEQKFHQLCGAVGDQAAEAQHSFAVPDPQLQRAWADALAELARGAKDCQDAAAPPQDGPHHTDAELSQLFIASLHEISNAYTDLLASLQAVMTAIGETTG